jgi:hypothetical protein
MKKFFFCFWPFVNAQVLLEVITKLPTKQKILLLMWEHICMCQLSKVPQQISVSVKYDEIWCGGIVFKRGNIANIS